MQGVALRAWVRAAAVLAAVVGFGGLVVLGVAWWVADLRTVPPYGDTVEYLRLSSTLQVDQFRTLFYPLVLRLLDRSTTAVYLVQTAAALASIAYLAGSLWAVSARTTALRWLAEVSPSKRRALLGTFTLVVFAQPLVNHHSLAMLSDSLAASFTTAAVAALVRIAVLQDGRIRTVVAALLCTAAAEWMRDEKVLVLGAVVAVVLVAALLRRLPRQAVAALAATLVVPAVAVAAVNHQTQTANLGRPPVDVSSRLFNRTVWPHMEALLALLPPAARHTVTPQDAVRFDADYNQILTMDPYLRHRAGGSPQLLDEMSRAALRCCWRAIAADTATDFAKYALPTASYTAGLLAPSSSLATGGNGWTQSRMETAHPALTRVYELWAAAVLLVVQLPLLLWLLVTARRRDGQVLGAVLIVAGTCLANAALFALTNSVPGNVRYALPAVVLLSAGLLWANAAVLWRRTEPRTDEQGLATAPG